MATYDYKCETCDIVEEHIHSMKDSPEIKCQKCGSLMSRQIGNSIGGFILRGGTESSHWNEKVRRMKRREELGKKEEQHRANAPKVAPNVGGMRVDTWRDAQRLAKEAGFSSESYQPMVDKEKPKIVI